MRLPEYDVEKWRDFSYMLEEDAFWIGRNISDLRYWDCSHLWCGYTTRRIECVCIYDMIEMVKRVHED